MSQSKPFELRVVYKGDLSRDFDQGIEASADPGGERWASGYDFGTFERDMAFDYKHETLRDEAVVRLNRLPGVHAEAR